MNFNNLFKFIFIILLLNPIVVFSKSKNTVTINIRNKTIKVLLKKIERQSNYTFVYSNSEIDENRKISYHASNQKITKVLNDIFNEEKISFQIMGKQIILKKRIISSPFSIPKNIKGRVVSAIENLPLFGVNLSIKGTSIGTSTDINGKFNLTIDEDNSILLISFIGYKILEINTAGKKNIKIILEEIIQQIDEVIVVGYGNESKKILSSSISDIKAKSINEIFTPNISESLKGKLTGVFVNQNSGTPGAVSTIRVRGISSITAGADPLYVIDGIPSITMNLSQISFSGQEISTIFNINPSDIESISILKDASATAIYGARGSNGVILITTKRGNSTQLIVKYDATYGFQQVAKTYNMLNAEGFMRYKNEAALNDGGMPIYTEENINNNIIDTDWQAELYRIAAIENHNFTLSGGSEVSQYYFNASYYNQVGIAQGTDYKRISSRLNLDYKLSKKIDIGAGIAIARSVNNRKEGDASYNGPVPNAIELAPIYPVFNEDGTYNDDGPLANPISIANYQTNVAYNWNTFANVFMNYKINNHLTYKLKLGVDYVNFREHSYDPQITRQGAKYQGLGEEATAEVVKSLISNIFNYFMFIDDKHKIDVLLGHEIDREEISSTFMRGEQFASEKLDYLVSSAEKISADANFRESFINSFFGRLKYNLNNKYVATFNVRYDGSSRFGPKNKYGFFPSGDVAWRISEEPFFVCDFINDLKIRASYGITGNDRILDFLYIPRFGTAEYAGHAVIYPSNISNPNLKWETTKQFNIGIDISLIKDRLTLNLDYYKKKTEDLLLEKPVPLSSGFTETISNIGKLENEGFEIGLNTINIKKEVLWISQLNISFNKNKITQLYNNQAIENIGRGYQRIELGEPIGIFYGYNSLGVDPSTGDLVFEDINADGIIDVYDKKKIGSPHAIFHGGLSNNISYRNFNLNFFFQFSYGNDVFNGTRRYIEAMKGLGNQTVETLNRWKKPGDITNMPRATNIDINENSRVSSRYIEDGSYLKLKTLRLSYNLSDKITHKLNIKSFSIFALAQNLFTLTNYSGMDPELNYDGPGVVKSGVEFFTYPSAKIFSLGLSVEF